MRAHPGAGLALSAGDLPVRHLLGDLATQCDRICAAFERRQVEPFVRGDEIDEARAAARPIEPALEQEIRDRGLRNRHRQILIDHPLKHTQLPFFLSAAHSECGPCPTNPWYPPSRCGLVDADHDRSNLKGSLKGAMNRA